MNCQCCYCAETQEVPSPPALHTCKRCGRAFRVYINRSGYNIELGKDAKEFFSKKVPV